MANSTKSLNKKKKVLYRSATSQGTKMTAIADPFLKKVLYICATSLGKGVTVIVDPV